MNKANIFFLNVLLIIFSLTAGYYFGKQGYEVEIKGKEVSIDIQNKTPNFDLTADFSVFWETWENINQKHINKPLDTSELVWGATKGLVEAVNDPYTIFLNPQENVSNDEILRGEYEGIGAELILKDEIVTIVSPFDSSPAKKAGLRPEDKILAVNDETTFGLSLFEVVEKIKGPRGSQVKLTISRKDREPFDVSIARDKIELKTVSYEEKSDQIVYIRISRFGEKTNVEWDNAVTGLISEYPKAKSVILDLRGNPGGFLGSAVHVASEFIPRGVVVKEEFSDGTNNDINTDHEAKLLGKRLIILLDKGSASASEILAGALKERAKGVLVGTVTFGKGTVQEPVDYKDGSGLNLTVGKWLTPEGYWVHEKGLNPDYIVELSDKDIEENNDLQLEKALELAQ